MNERDMSVKWMEAFYNSKIYIDDSVNKDILKDLQNYTYKKTEPIEPTEKECCDKLDKIPTKYIERYLRRKKLDKLEQDEK